MTLTHIAHKVRNVTRGAIQRYGLLSMKRHLWDREFASGRWKCLEDAPTDCLYPHVERYVAKGNILDLGCGPGATANALNPGAYTLYTGIDISAVAIDKARKKSAENHRTAKAEYWQAEIYTYKPTRRYDVIVLGDSLCYIPENRITPMLLRYCDYLTPSGVIIVRLRGYPGVINIVESQLAVLEKHLYHNSEVCVIIGRHKNESMTVDCSGMSIPKGS